MAQTPVLKKSASTGTINVDCNISNPNVLRIIKSVAIAVHSTILMDTRRNKPISKYEDLYFFTEEKYIKENQEAFDEEQIKVLREMPTVEDIYEFIKAFYDSISGSPASCYIAMLVYINRLITFTEVPLAPTTWRPLIFTSLLVAHKVIDDRIYANTDFTLIYNFFDTKELG